MSTRLGIELAVDPAFTARAYRARNIICGQYASWAAEMHMLRMSVMGYFRCSDPVLNLLSHGVSRLAEDSRKRTPRFSVNCLGVTNGRNSGDASSRNSVYLDFQSTDTNHPLAVLHREATTMISELPGAHLPDGPGLFQPRINLIEYATLPPTVMADASDFAKGVAMDVGVPVVARAWRLVLLRYHSDAAGDDWSNGSWATDVRWEYISSYVL